MIAVVTPMTKYAIMITVRNTHTHMDMSIDHVLPLFFQRHPVHPILLYPPKGSLVRNYCSNYCIGNLPLFWSVYCEIQVIAIPDLQP